MHAPSPGAPEVIADALLDSFRSTFGRDGIGCFMAPGRVNLIGEHVDYNEGRCLPMALPHASYAVLAPRDDDRVSVASLQQDEPWNGRLGSIGPGDVTGWGSYVVGVIWALAEDGIDLPGLDVLVDSRVPVGAGLSSSAALECSVALGLCAVTGVDADDEVRRRLVTACMRAETEVAGAPTGGMDQTIALLAEPGHALLLDCRDWSTEQVPWKVPAHELCLLVIDTRAHHSLNDGGYRSRRRDCEAAAADLGVASLRDVEDASAALEALSDPQVQRRARHVFSEMARVEEAVESLRRDDLVRLGRLFDASHASLRDDFEVSCAELDVAVSTATGNGALGARMTGGGFGGSAIALVPTARLDAVADAVTDAFATRGWREPAFLMAEAAAGARQVR